MAIFLSFERAARLDEEVSVQLRRNPDQSREEVEETLALKYNFGSWKQLQRHLSHENSETKDFLELACLQYFHDDGPDRWQKAKEMLEATPELEYESIYHACAIGSYEQVLEHLIEDATLVNTPGGPMDWQPLMYACYSRLDLPGKSTLKVVKALLERGADPNAHFMWGGQYRFTALTAAFGEGEQGPQKQPAHICQNELVPLLLAYGAYPNDSQAIYNRMFSGGVDHLRVLLKHGLTQEDTCNWLNVNKLGRFYPSKIRALSYLFDHALVSSHHEVVELLMSQGVVLNRMQTQTAHRKALLNGDTATAALLLKFGVKKARLNQVERFVSASMQGDVEKLKKKEAELRQLCKDAMKRHPTLLINAISKNRLRTIYSLLDCGWDINDSRCGRTALHEAAYLGQLDLVSHFVKLGANLDQRDQRFNSTPYQWASVNNQAETAKYLDNARKSHS